MPKKESPILNSYRKILLNFDSGTTKKISTEYYKDFQDDISNRFEDLTSGAFGSQTRSDEQRPVIFDYLHSSSKPNEAEQENRELKERIGALQAENASLRSGANKALQDEIGKQAINVELTMEVSALTQRVEGLTEDLRAARDHRGQLEADIREKTQKVQALQGRVQDLQGTCDSSRDEIARLKDEVWSLRAEKAILREDLKIANARESYRLDRKDPSGFYKCLGIDPDLVGKISDAQLKELIEKTYRAYSMVFHPDQGGDTVNMQAINEAYSFLRNDSNRKRYGK